MTSVTPPILNVLRRVLGVAALAALLSGCTLARAPRATGSVDTGSEGAIPLSEEMGRYFTELAARGLFNGNVSIAADGQLVLRESFTVPSAPDGMATAVEDQFMLASVSKLLIKYAVYALHEAGRLSLDTPVSRWIDGLPYGDRISVEHLVDHASGLPRELQGVDDLTRVSSEEFLQLAGREALLFEPGADTLYSNVGYQLLAEILSTFSREGYDAVVESYVTGPLGMVDTAEYLSRPPERLARGFELDDGRIATGDLAELSRFRYLRLYSTVDDLHRFGSALFDRSRTPERVLERMLSGGKAVTHAGAMEGYRAYFHAEPETRTIIAFLSNFEGIPFVRITEDVPKILAGEPYEVPRQPHRVAVAVDAEILERYAGRYRLDVDADQIFEVRFDGAHLEVVDAEGESSVLFAETISTFFTEPSSSDTVGFALDRSTGAYRMFLIVEGGMRLATTRID